MEQNFTEIAKCIRDICLSSLLVIIHHAHKSEKGYQAYAFNNPDRYSKYEEIMYLCGEWVLVDGDGLLYNTSVMPLEELCTMVDSIYYTIPKKHKED